MTTSARLVWEIIPGDITAVLVYRSIMGDPDTEVQIAELDGSVTEYIDSIESDDSNNYVYRVVPQYFRNFGTFEGLSAQQTQSIMYNFTGLPSQMPSGEAVALVPENLLPTDTHEWVVYPVGAGEFNGDVFTLTVDSDFTGEVIVTLVVNGEYRRGIATTVLGGGVS